MRERIATLHDQLQNDMRKFFSDGVAVAGTRARVKAQELKKALTELRTQIQQIKKERK